MTKINEDHGKVVAAYPEEQGTTICITEDGTMWWIQSGEDVWKKCSQSIAESLAATKAEEGA